MKDMFRFALALASAFGHEWAGVEGVGAVIEAACAAPEATPQSVCAAIAVHTEKQSANIMGGIQAPRFDSDAACISHATGSGRLNWEVYPDGYVRVIVSRPALQALVDAGIANAPEALREELSAALLRGERPRWGQDILIADLSHDGTAAVRVAEEGLTKAVRLRHVVALREALHALRTAHPAGEAAMTALETWVDQEAYHLHDEAEAARRQAEAQDERVRLENEARDAADRGDEMGQVRAAVRLSGRHELADRIVAVTLQKS